MCTNSARLVNSLECYMDDLVDCFEDFVKKSLLIISVAVGALIVMLGYALKIVTERAQPRLLGENTRRLNRADGTVSRAENLDVSPRASVTNLDVGQDSKGGAQPQKPRDSVTMPCFRKDCVKSAGANTGPLSSVPSFDEKVLRNIGLSSCSKSCMQSKRSIMRNSSASRLAVASLPTCIPNHHLSTPRPCSKFVRSRNSCCSMCCADDDRR